MVDSLSSRASAAHTKAVKFAGLPPAAEEEDGGLDFVSSTNSNKDVNPTQDTAQGALQGIIARSEAGQAPASQKRVQYPNGDVYEGYCTAEDKKHGQGVYTVSVWRMRVLPCFVLGWLVGWLVMALCVAVLQF